MRYAGIIKNDFSAGDGVCVSFFTQGCTLHCEGCHNPETWDPQGGREFTNEVLQDILNSIVANGIQRNFCVMGGEPLNNINAEITALVIKEVKSKYPNIKIYVWSGFTYQDIKRAAVNDKNINYILNTIDVLIDGPFILSERDITLPMRGSRNQTIINLKEINA